jgi:hypothetical protein
MIAYWNGEFRPKEEIRISPNVLASQTARENGSKDMLFIRDGL